MADLEKEQQIVLIIENAQLDLKKIIQQGLLLNLEKEQLKAMTIKLRASAFSMSAFLAARLALSFSRLALK